MILIRLNLAFTLIYTDMKRSLSIFRFSKSYKRNAFFITKNFLHIKCNCEIVCTFASKVEYFTLSIFLLGYMFKTKNCFYMKNIYLQSNYEVLLFSFLSVNQLTSFFKKRWIMSKNCDLREDELSVNITNLLDANL